MTTTEALEEDGVYWVTYGVYCVPTKHWYIVLLSFELTVEKLSIEVYTYMPPAVTPDEALFALMRPLYGTTPSGPVHWKESGLSVKCGRLKEPLY